MRERSKSWQFRFRAKSNMETFRPMSGFGGYGDLEVKGIFFRL
jgi:hypothetical protein